MASRIGAEWAGTKGWTTENVVAMGGPRYRRGEYGSGFRECTSLRLISPRGASAINNFASHSWNYSPACSGYIVIVQLVYQITRSSPYSFQLSEKMLSACHALKTHLSDDQILSSRELVSTAKQRPVAQVD